jgi:hypothetical protein
MGGMVSRQTEQDLASLLHRGNQISLRAFVLFIVHDAPDYVLYIEHLFCI